MKRKITFAEKQRPTIEVQHIYVGTIDEAKSMLQSLATSTLPYKERLDLMALLNHYIATSDDDGVIVYETDGFEYHIGNHAQEARYE